MAIANAQTRGLVKSGAKGLLSQYRAWCCLLATSLFVSPRPVLEGGARIDAVTISAEAILLLEFIKPTGTRLQSLAASTRRKDARLLSQVLLGHRQPLS